jgi:hypothetical protein
LIRHINRHRDLAASLSNAVDTGEVIEDTNAFEHDWKWRDRFRAAHKSHTFVELEMIPKV